MTSVKKRLAQTDLTELSEPSLSPHDRLDFDAGIELFNNGSYWGAHEAWEAVWQRKSDNSRIFFQGMIQIAAGMHQLGRGIFHGADKHFRNAFWKLEPFPENCLGINVKELLTNVHLLHSEILRLGPQRLDKLEYKQPTIKKRS